MTDVENDDAAELVRTRAESCQKAIDDYFDGTLTMEAVIGLLQQHGASIAEGTDYLRQLSDRIDNRAEADTSRRDFASGGSRAVTPDGLDSSGVEEFHAARAALEEEREREDAKRRKEASERLGWAVLRRKAGMLEALAPTSRKADSAGLFSAEEISAILETHSASGSSSIPQAVLDGAPHLSALVANTGNSHLDATWKLRRLYTGDKVVEALIDTFQRQRLDEPIPRSIWKEIILDRFVSFEKLFAAMEPGYDHQDDLKDFHGGFALVKKDQVLAKKPVASEGDWSRVFTAWSVGVSMAFPHREGELKDYKRMVVEIFRAVSHSASAGIKFDLDVRMRYAKEPFRMDQRDQLQIALFSQMFSPVSSPSKRSFPGQLTPNVSKRSEVCCINWNYNNCEEPCPNRRKHGECSACHGKHRARDIEACFTTLKAAKGKGTALSSRISGASSGRT